MKTYIIWAPDYNGTSGGIRALYLLCHKLNLRGARAKVSSRITHPSLNAPTIDIQTVNFQDDNIVAIYPEIVRGNPWNARHVVRWVLQVPGMLNGDPTYDPSEQVFVYEPAYMKSGGYLGRLYIPTIELELFNMKETGPRSGGCFWVHKGWQTPRIPETQGLPEITGAWPATREALASYLKKREFLYSYDNCTALVDEARLCGCPVILIPDLHNDYNLEAIGELMKLGIARDIHDIKRAKSELPAFVSLYMTKVKDSEKDLDAFIELTTKT